ncbi:hypothetical protein CLU79DRAFT_365743 [Phycomyces nitens]|nr:hypothetical protein CLU79DRAFT_365743 [Phycomyces nitens]
MQHHHCLFLCLVLMTFAHWKCEAFDFKNLLFGQQEVPLGAPFPFGFPETPASRKADLVSCNGYLCDDTLKCVREPSECPCRRETEIKCSIGDWYTCVRGDQDCNIIEYLD